MTCYLNSEDKSTPMLMTYLKKPNSLYCALINPYYYVSKQMSSYVPEGYYHHQSISRVLLDLLQV